MEEETSEEPVDVEEPSSSETELEQPEETVPVISEESIIPVDEDETPSVTTPITPKTPIVPKTGAAPTRSNSWMIFLGVVAAGIIMIGIIYWRTRAVRRRIYEPDTNPLASFPFLHVKRGEASFLEW